VGKEEERIEEIKKEIRKTQVNKRTEFHLCRLRARLSELEKKIETKNKTVSHEATFEMAKVGCARVGLYGFPSVGKSSFLNLVTNAHSEVGAFEFTTLTCIPGTLSYGGAEIQLLDLPGVIEAASKGKGRGKQVLAALRSCELILMFLDPTQIRFRKAKQADKLPKNPEISSDSEDESGEDYIDASTFEQLNLKDKIENVKYTKNVLLSELKNVGIRINKTLPDIEISRKCKGITISASPALPKDLETEIKDVISKELRINSISVNIRKSANLSKTRTQEDVLQDVIDVIQGNKIYLNCLFVYNKVESLGFKTQEEEERFFELVNAEDSLAISCDDEINIEELKMMLWKRCGLVRVFLKGKNKSKFDKPIVVEERTDIKGVCKKVHSSFVGRFKHAFVWGRSVKFQPQKVGINHVVEDLDVVQLVLN